MDEVLNEAGVGPDLANTGMPGDISALQELVPAAVAAARDRLLRKREEWNGVIDLQLREHESRLDQWEQLSLLDIAGSAAERRVRQTATRQRRLANSLRTSGEPYLRVLAVLEGAR